MNGFYNLLLYIFVISAVLTGVNDISSSNVVLPETGVTTSQSVVTDVTDGVTKTTAETGFFDIPMLFFNAILGGVVAIFTVIPLIMNLGATMGAPTIAMAIIAGILQVPLWFVELYGLYEIVAGRSVT